MTASSEKRSVNYRDWTVLITGGSGFIGTNLSDHLTGLGCNVVNGDIRAPLKRQDLANWRALDVTDAAAVQELMHEVTPSHIVHLAARVDVEGRTVDDYVTNSEGTRVTVEAAKELPRLQQFIVTSTQFVCQPGYVPENDTDFAPHTAYGASKAASEMIVREIDPPYSWVVIRPTTLWGPGDDRYRATFYKLMRRGLYAHPSGTRALRSYGYVGNAVQQIRTLLELEDKVRGDVYYVGDPVADLHLFVDAFSYAFRNKPARRLPRAVIKGLAKVGDLLGNLGVRAPMTSQRYSSMTEDYLVPIDRTFEVTGSGPYSLEEGVAATVRSLNERGASTDS